MLAAGPVAVTPSSAPVRPVRLGRHRHVFEHRPDGAILIRATEPLGPYPDRVTDRLVHHARTAPDRTFVAKRGPDGAWRHLTYAAALVRAEALGAALLERGLSAERPLAILSGNDLDHAAMALAAMHVGIPYVPISPAYSGVGGAYGRLRDILSLVTPGLVFAAEGEAFDAAIAAAAPDIDCVRAGAVAPSGRTTLIEDFIDEGRPGAAQAAHEAVGPDTIAKILFTSGSTGLPKGVITTHRMLCANQAQIASAMPFLLDEPPVLVDWLPWHHVFGGSHNFGIALFNGGSLYVDEGRPLPALIGETVRNLSEIAPTCYFTVPKGYEALVPHLRADAAFRASFFSRLKLAFFAAAGLPQPVWDAFDAVAIAETGERIVMLTGLGSTETAPFAIVCAPEHCRSGRVGLPVPGVELKLAPVADKMEARVRGPNVTPGYVHNDAMSTASRDEEGYYRLGDAMLFVDPDDPQVGLFFDGRLNEDFKLTSGVWVSVGPLRARFLDAAAPYARDVVVAGENRDDIRVLVVPDIAACRALAPDGVTDDVLSSPGVRRAFGQILADLAAGATGGSNRIVCAILLADPPSLDLNEVTDKGSVNQRAMLKNRAEHVEALYALPARADVITPHEAP